MFPVSRRIIPTLRPLWSSRSISQRASVQATRFPSLILPGRFRAKSLSTTFTRFRTTYSSQPSNSRNLFNKFNEIPPTAIVVTILGLNLAVYMMWQGAIGEAREGNWKEITWMKQNFLTSAENIRSGRIWVLFTSLFSHEGLGHLLFNSFTFFFFGPPAIQILGNTAFLTLYIGGGLFSSAVSAGWRSLRKRSGEGGSHGASGAIYSVVSFLACVAPQMKIYLYGILPIPAWALVPGILLWDGWSALTKKNSGTDHAGHVAGIFAGVLYYMSRLR